MQIDPRDWSQVSALLDRALDLEEAERAAWLEELSRTQPQLAPGVRRLLERLATLETDDFLSTLPPLALLAGLPEAQPSLDALPPGSVVGAYVLEAEIGRGGMGIIYRAHRADGIIKRVVAVKLLHPSLQSRELSARFARERDILARLTHPNIARLYDAGLTASGQMYLVLEIVEGTSLIAYCDAHRLDLRARIELFGQVLRAVHFAHSNLVIHRDLKPANILVTNEGEVRLLDFGIAKLLPEASAAEPALTEIGANAMTPDYCAPEQITAGAITTATDVYAAGVVLFELMTGLRPYRLKRCSRGALEDAIVAGEALDPSRAALSPEQASARDTTPARLHRLLRGDLDTIVRKALRKEPHERYSSVDAMYQDLRRYLQREPVLARPDRSWYRIGKFVSRHKLSVALASALAIAVIAGLGVALWALGTAQAQTARAEAAKSFLVRVFSTGSPSKMAGKNITASEILARGSSLIDTELKDQPALLGELHGAIADIYSSFGANEDVLPHAQRAIALLEQAGDRRSEAYFSALHRLADSYKEEEHWPEARAAYQRLRAAAAARYGPVNRWEARSLEDLIWVEEQNGRLPEAQAAAVQALKIAKALYGEKSSPYMRILGTTEQLALDRGQPDQALAITTQLIALAPAVPDYALADLLMDRYMHASTLYRLQRFQESMMELRNLVPDMEANMGMANDRTIKARATLALDLMQLGELSEALEVEQRNFELLRNARTGDKDLLVTQSATLGRILARAGRLSEAIPMLREALAYFDGRYLSPTPFRELVRATLGDMLLRDGLTDEGLKELQLAVANMNSLKDFQPDPHYADMLLAEGNGYRLLGRVTEAQAAFTKACALYDEMLGNDSIAKFRCRLYQLLNAPVPAVGVANPDSLAEFHAIRERLLTALPPQQALRAELLLIEAQLQLRAGMADAAQPLEAQGAQVYRSLVGTDPPRPLRALH